ncbi:hypothetical protein T12_241 [Trichinella patagoniensis]|uniref:Uncharacterized protein n=1 Tax=Trichinella patagoniensis TaxID=990121 RepID=A0A0V0ZET1_9BILA|nr:hypothetical protein T12_241 [Trichinella patagoniensis]
MMTFIFSHFQNFYFYNRNGKISGQVVMASDGTYWYLLLYFDKILPDMNDKPKNWAVYKIFEKHHLIKFVF